MITEHDLQEAIAECQGQRNPNANTCIKLAAYLTIQRELFGDTELSENQFAEDDKMVLPTYSYAPAPISYSADTPFGRLIEGKDIEEVMPLLDELIETIQLINPRLYEGFLRKMREI